MTCKKWRPRIPLSPLNEAAELVASSHFVSTCLTKMPHKWGRNLSAIRRLTKFWWSQSDQRNAYADAILNSDERGTCAGGIRTRSSRRTHDWRLFH
jgi:hypothetical protein